MDKIQIVKALEEERAALTEKIKSLDMTILTLKQSMSVSYSATGVEGNGYSVPVIKYAGYKDAKNNKNKAKIIIKEAGKFLHIRQIKDIALSLETGSNKEETVKSIAQAIYALKADGAIVGYKASSSNLDTFWGSKNWLDEQGRPKAAHMYDEDQLSVNIDQGIEI